MIIIPPKSDSAVKLWRAQLEAHDLPSASLMIEQVEKWGLDLPENWIGTNESPYLAAAVGASLATTLNFLSRKEASRIDVNPLLGSGMRDAALMELCNAGSFFDWGSLRNSFEIFIKGDLSKDDHDYLALYCAQLVKPDRARRWAACVIELDLNAGNSGLLPAENLALIEEILDKLPHEFGYDAARVEDLHLLLTQFDARELGELLTFGLKPREFSLIARLRRELGDELGVVELIAEMRSMNPIWLEALLG